MKLFFMLSLFSASVLANQSPNSLQLQSEAKAKIAAFAGELKTTLQSSIKQGGTLNGIKVCSEVANGIAQRHSANGWQVGRTSLKLRNPENVPDKWELKQLRHFEAKHASGDSADTLMVSDIVTLENGEKAFRLMKAIPTGGLCLQCHGQQIDSRVQQLLAEKYPKDMATGYILGEIRGAFTLTKPIK